MQAINCTGTDNQKQRNKTSHTPKHRRETEKTALAKETNYTVVWYAVYNLRLENGVGPVLTTLEPAWHVHLRHICTTLALSSLLSFATSYATDCDGVSFQRLKI